MTGFQPGARLRMRIAKYSGVVWTLIPDLLVEGVRRVSVVENQYWERTTLEAQSVYFGLARARLSYHELRWEYQTFYWFFVAAHAG